MIPISKKIKTHTERLSIFFSSLTKISFHPKYSSQNLTISIKDGVRYLKVDDGISYENNLFSGNIKSNKYLDSKLKNSLKPKWKKEIIFFLKNGYVYGLEGIVKTVSKRFLRHSVRTYGRAIRSHRLFGKKITKSKYLQGRILVIKGPSGENLFHFLTESLTRYQMASQMKLKYDYILVSGDNELQKKIIKTCGLEKEKLIFLNDNELMQCDELIVPSFQYDGRLNPNMSKIFDQIRRNCIPRSNLSHEKIFINRRNSRVLLDPRIKDYFKEKGFFEVFLEDYNFYDQVSLFFNASFIVGIHGAGMTHLLFSRRGSTCIEFFNKGFVNLCYAKIGLIRGLDYHILVDGSEKKIKKKSSRYNKRNIKLNLNDVKNYIENHIKL